MRKAKLKVKIEMAHFLQETTGLLTTQLIQKKAAAGMQHSKRCSSVLMFCECLLWNHTVYLISGALFLTFTGIVAGVEGAMSGDEFNAMMAKIRRGEQ